MHVTVFLDSVGENPDDVIREDNRKQSVVGRQQDTPCVLFPVRQGWVIQRSRQNKIFLFFFFYLLSRPDLRMLMHLSPTRNRGSLPGAALAKFPVKTNAINKKMWSQIKECQILHEGRDAVRLWLWSFKGAEPRGWGGRKEKAQKNSRNPTSATAASQEGVMMKQSLRVLTQTEKQQEQMWSREMRLPMSGNVSSGSSLIECLWTPQRREPAWYSVRLSRCGCRSGPFPSIDCLRMMKTKSGECFPVKDGHFCAFSKAGPFVNANESQQELMSRSALGSLQLLACIFLWVWTCLGTGGACICMENTSWQLRACGLICVQMFLLRCMCYSYKSSYAWLCEWDVPLFN